MGHEVQFSDKNSIIFIWKRMDIGSSFKYRGISFDSTDAEPDNDDDGK